MSAQQNLQRPALAALFLLQLIMLGALFADVDPHPPLTIPLGGMGPFLGASLSVVAAAWISGSRGLSLLAAVLALVSFGPQKFFDAQIALVFPAVVTAQIAVLALIVDGLPSRLKTRLCPGLGRMS